MDSWLISKVSWLLSYANSTCGLCQQIFGAIFGAIATAVVPPTISWISWKYRVSAFHKVFQIGNRAEITCIIPSIDFPEFDQPEYLTYATPFESVFFFKNFRPFAKQLGVNQDSVRIRLSKEAEDDDLQRNLFCLGGPIHNDISAVLLEEVRHEVSFVGHDLICPNRTGKTRYSAEIENNQIKTDVALLMVTPNPSNSEKKAILLAGCRGYASIPIFGHICKHSTIKELGRKRKPGNSKHFFAVYTVRLRHSTTMTYHSIKLEDVWTA